MVSAQMTRTGYTLALANTADAKQGANAVATSVNGATYYAIWQPAQYKLTVDPNAAGFDKYKFAL